MAPTVTMTMEEYLAIMKQIEEMGPGGRKHTDRGRSKLKAIRQKARKKDPKMSKALAMANEKARKKNGEFRVGYDQSKLMSLAHKIRRKL